MIRIGSLIGMIRIQGWFILLERTISFSIASFFRSCLNFTETFFLYNVPANEFLNLEGDKMSTSRNWKLEMRDYINDFVKPANGGGQCVDMLRYYLTLIAPETKGQ